MHLIREKTSQTYRTLFFSDFHGMLHIGRLQHDRVIRLAFLLHKLLLIVCLLRAETAMCDFFHFTRRKMLLKLGNKLTETIETGKMQPPRTQNVRPQLVCHNLHFRLGVCCLEITGCV